MKEFRGLTLLPKSSAIQLQASSIVIPTFYPREVIYKGSKPNSFSRNGFKLL
ncbi:hypothetical protein IFO69_15550 [Echinicola sp. CAU 1574]|uniref:Uncharacterized protein n=1 Tax=Echinicola arenosa TaxID=2774144 RepID=A0ABR9AN22_9BACT|nr:hypothetical protein [Echinicola arenosa]MBD8490170.1 hypothetical protein [Echinicola arenosa]